MRTFGRALFSLLIIGAIVALGYGVWDAGYQQGLVETADAAREVIVTPYPGYYGFGVFGLVFKVFLAFLLFGLLFKVLFGRRYWRRYRMDGPDHYRAKMESRMERWHDEAHGRTPRGDPEDSG